MRSEVVVAWAHRSVLDRRKSEVSVLRDFQSAGDLVICERLGDNPEAAASGSIYDNPDLWGNRSTAPARPPGGR
jgi:hypothetical protein